MKPGKIVLSLALVIILTTSSWITSCTHQTDTSNVPEICFKDVYNIIQPNCVQAGCHDGNSEARDYTSYQGIRNAVVPGDPDKSPLYKAITSVRGENKMPPDEPIAEELRSTIRYWIEQGAVDSTENSSLCLSSKRTGKRNGNIVHTDY